MSYRLQTPSVKAVLLTTIYCATAGGITQFLSNIQLPQAIGFCIPEVLFSVAILMSFRSTASITVLRIALMLIVMFGIFYGELMLMAIGPEALGAYPFARQVSDWVVSGLPGMAAIIAIGIILKVRITILNVLIAGICSGLGFFLSNAIASNSLFSTGPIFIFWQTLVGFACGLANVRKVPGAGTAGR